MNRTSEQGKDPAVQKRRAIREATGMTLPYSLHSAWDNHGRVSSFMPAVGSARKLPLQYLKRYVTKETLTLL